MTTVSSQTGGQRSPVSEKSRPNKLTSPLKCFQLVLRAHFQPGGFFFFFKMSEPPEIRVSSIEMHQPGSSLPRSMSCHVQKTADTAEGGLRDCTPLPLRPIINTDAGSAGGVEGVARSSDPDAFAPTRLGSPTGTAGAHVVPGDGGGQVEVGSPERLPDIVLLPPPRRGEHVASEQT